jgi:pimeloyl-ACP methyl ester carboxylesterase
VLEVGLSVTPCSDNRRGFGVVESSNYLQNEEFDSMRRRHFLTALACTAAVSVTAATTVVPGRAAASESIVDIPVSFHVKNVNQTSVACTSDGGDYTVRGHITGPRDAVDDPSAVTLYLHAVTQGEFHFRFRAVEGYDFTHQEAENGHVSVTIDRLGYGDSDKPPGDGSCFGSQATVAHQVVQELRSGDYDADYDDTPKFDQVFIAGHSAGGLTATIESYTFHDTDGMIDLGWADQTDSAFTVEQLADSDLRCVKGGDKDMPHYTPFGNDPEGILFYSASQEVRDAVPAPAPDPCGDLESFQQGIAADVPGLPQYQKPVLLLFGDKDKLCPPPAGELQKERYLLNPDVTLTMLPNTAHGILYEATHLRTVHIIDQWLNDHEGHHSSSPLSELTGVLHTG